MKLLDGRPNPFFGRPYLGVYDPTTSLQPFEEQKTKSYRHQFRDVMISDHPLYAPPGQPKANRQPPAAPVATRTTDRFYVGDANGQNVDYAPSGYAHGDYIFSWFVLLGWEFDYPAIDGWRGDWAERSGKTQTNGVVVRPLRGWKWGESMRTEGTLGRFAAEAFHGMQFHYNESDSFRPATPAVNLLLEPVPNPTFLQKQVQIRLSRPHRLTPKLIA